MTRKGTFIVVEGIDGAGKTTQVGLLESYFQRAGLEVVRSKEPTDGPWGRKIRASATSGRMSLQDELEAFMADRREHVEQLINPSLEQGKTVLVDRYFYSTIAYQGARGADVAELAAIMTKAYPIPDAVLLIDVLPEVGQHRIRTNRGEIPNEFENVNNLAISRQIFLELAKTHPVVKTIDGNQVEHEVQKQILEAIRPLLKEKHCVKAYGCDEPELCGYRATGECAWAKMVAMAGSMNAIKGG